MVFLGDVVNFVICGWILIISICFTSRLHKGVKAIPLDVRDASSPVFIYYSSLWWCAAWSIWLLLYAGKIIARSRNLSGTAVLLDLLSDTNSICFLMMAYILAQGNHKERNARLVLLSLVTSVGILNLSYCIFANLAAPSAPYDIFMTLFSSALSMIAPVFVGRALALRFNTKLAEVVVLIYAALQPIAYGAMTRVSEGRSVEIQLSQRIDISDKLKPYVEIKEVNDTITCIVTRQVGETRMKERQQKTLLDVIRNASDSTGEFLIFRLRLQFEEIVFCTLGLLKILFAYSTLRCLRNRPFDCEPNLRFTANPVNVLVQQQQWLLYSFALVVGSAGVLCIAFWTFGQALGLLVAVLSGAALFVAKLAEAGYIESIKKLFTSKK